MLTKKIKIISLLLFCLLLGGSKYFPERKLPSDYLSGIITLKLRNAVWRFLNDQPIYQDLFLDLNCEHSKCESKIYGFAPKYNQYIEHQGIVEEVTVKDNAWNIQVKLKVRPSPVKMETQLGTYEIQIIPFQKNQLIGSYTGELNKQLLGGKVVGSIKPQWIEEVKNYQPIQPQEHPRLIFRAEQLDELRNKAKTKTGQAILTQLKQSLNKEIFYQGYGLNGGSHAAGICFLALLHQDKQQANKAWKLTQKVIAESRSPDGKSKPRVLELSELVAHIALAYDLCYPLWSREQQQSLTKWLANQTVNLTNGGGKNWNNNIISNWNARARAGAGIAALAIKQEPSAFFPDNEYFAQTDNLDLFLDTATRKIIRYLDVAIGDRGFGIEGDTYTNVSADLILPFLQAYANVMGKDLVTNSEGAWFIPNAMMRMVLQDDGVFTPAYGRHHAGAGGSLFAYGLATLPEQFLPSTLWTFNRYFGGQGNQSFGVSPYAPHTAIYALVGYREEIKPENPETFLDKVMVDSQRGLFVFRNQWQNDQDIVASIYLKQNPVKGGWSFPEVGSFRITGLGMNWATAGVGDGKPDRENSVYLPNAQPWRMSQPVAFVSKEDGSGIVSLKTQELTNRKEKLKLGLIRSFGVDYSKISGADAVFAVTDVFNGDFFHSFFQEKVWLMHTEGEVSIKQNKFTIKAPSGATLQGIFASPVGVNISYEKTDTGGRIKATGGNQFFVVMSIQSKNPPPLKLLDNFGINSTVQVGKQKVRYIRDRIVFEHF
jgi:hypothetical protein